MVNLKVVMMEKLLTEKPSVNRKKKKKKKKKEKIRINDSMNVSPHFTFMQFIFSRSSLSLSPF